MIVANIFFGVLPLYLLIKFWQDLKEKDNGYSTNCYTRNDGKICYISCKEISDKTEICINC